MTHLNLVIPLRAVVNFYLLVYFPLYYALWTFLESLVGGLTFLRG